VAEQVRVAEMEDQPVLLKEDVGIRHAQRVRDMRGQLSPVLDETGAVVRISREGQKKEKEGGQAPSQHESGS
jgi:hypothetical protein